MSIRVGAPLWGAVFAGLLLIPVEAATPASGTVSPTATRLTYTSGPFATDNQTGAAGFLADPAGILCTPAQLNPCDDYALTIVGPATTVAGSHVQVSVSWPDSVNDDYDIYLMDSAGSYIGMSNGTADPEVIDVPVAAGTNTYTVRIVPIATSGGNTRADISYLAGAAGGGVPILPPPPPTRTGAGIPRYNNFAAPPAIGENAGEPSLGYNINTKRAMYISGLQTLRITFPENVTPAGSLPEACDANWEDVSYVVTSTKSLDPILYTDRVSGRTFVSQLNSTVPPASPVLIGANSLFAYTDDDGANWTPGQIAAPDGSYDHQTVGAGPFPAALSALANPSVNKNLAVYYCSQAGVTAFCSRSDTGGLTFNRSTPIYNALTDGCGGIHGHVKVAPDGTVYVPNRGCGANQAVTVSSDAGTTWTVRKVPQSKPPSVILDPSVGIGSDGTAYFCYVNNDGHPHVAVSKDKGLTWINDRDIGDFGATPGIKNAVFVEAIAGDPDRAACGFVGTTQDGNHEALDFPGIWYAFIAHTYDGGKTWSTVNATPDRPVQREGGIWNQGGNSPNRNLLDFNEITLDEKGRVLYSFADGCVGDCEIIGPNSFSSKATIARQSGGRGLFAAKDTAEPALPQRACLFGRRDDQAAHLSWRAPDNGGTPITRYDIFRGPAAGAETTLVGHTTTKTAYNDRTADPAIAKYFYKVKAVNSVGESGLSNGIELPLLARLEATGACSLPGVQVITDPIGDVTTRQPSQDISSVSMAEPDSFPGKIIFTIKVVNLSTIPPGFRWAVRFGAPKRPPNDVTGSPAEDYFVSMTTADGPAPTFTYGVTSVPQNAARVFTTLGSLDPASNAAADGTITLILNRALIGSPTPGQGITGMLASVRATAPSALPTTGGTNETIADSTGGGAYTLRQPNLCLSNAAPLAVLASDKDVGLAPLTVVFNAGGSSDGDSIDTIAGYTFSFGDDSDEITQNSPTISHTYAAAGNYAAKLVVTDSRGKLSSNTAQRVIQPRDQPPPPASPTPFTYVQRDGVATSTFITSEAVTLSGYTGSLPVSIGNGQYRIDGGAFTTASGQIAAGSTLTVRHVSASTANAPTQSMVTVGGYSTTFRSVTSAIDRTPDGFTFGTLTGQAPGAVVESAVQTLTGFNAAAAIVPGPGISYRINGGSYTTAQGSLQPGDTLQVQHTTSTTSLAYTKTYLKVGGVVGYFTTRTR